MSVLAIKPTFGLPDRWRIKDMTALENAPERMDLLLRGARRYLKKENSAISPEFERIP